MFPPPHFKYASVAQLVEQRTENPRVVGSIPTGGTTCKSLAGICGHSSSGRAPPCQGGGSEFEPRCPLQKNSYAGLIARITYIRRHSQVVRQRTANPRFPSSNLGGASNKKPALVAGFLLEMSLPMLDWLSDGPLCGPSPRRGFKSGWRLLVGASFISLAPTFSSQSALVSLLRLSKLTHLRQASILAFKIIEHVHTTAQRLN